MWYASQYHVKTENSAMTEIKDAIRLLKENLEVGKLLIHIK
jgi:predicted RNase H-like HicB family nuclease